MSVVTGSTAQLSGTNIAAASARLNISPIATYISSVQPTITPHGTPTTTAFSSSTGGTVNLRSGISTNDCIAITCCGGGDMSSPSLSDGGNCSTKELGPTSFNSNGASMTTLVWASDCERYESYCRFWGESHWSLRRCCLSRRQRVALMMERPPQIPAPAARCGHRRIPVRKQGTR